MNICESSDGLIVSLGIGVDLSQIQQSLRNIFHGSNMVWQQLMQGEEIDGLSIQRDATMDLSNQYQQLMINNNSNPHHNTVIVKTIEEIMKSQDVLLVVYRGILVGGIRLQEQDGPEGSTTKLYQRASLLMRPGFRAKDLDGFMIADLLVKTMNELHQNKSIYGITKTMDVVRKNEAAGNKYMTVGELETQYPEFYQYVIDSRGGNDFKDIHDDEKPQEHYFIYNGAMKQWLDDFYCQNIDTVEYLYG